jgi:hypothetical protein
MLCAYQYLHALPASEARAPFAADCIANEQLTRACRTRIAEREPMVSAWPFTPGKTANPRNRAHTNGG